MYGFAIVFFASQLQISQCSTPTNSKVTDVKKNLSCGIDVAVSWNITNPSELTSTLDETTSNITVTDPGEYQCYSVNGSLLETFIHGKVAKPEIKPEDTWENTKLSTTYTADDVDRTLTCSSKGSYPSDLQFRWYATDVDYDVELQTNDTYNIIKIDNYTSQLKFLGKLTPTHAGHYSCNVSHVRNVSHPKSVVMWVRVHPNYDWALPLAGIAIQSAVLVGMMYMFAQFNSKKRNATVATEQKNSDDE